MDQVPGVGARLKKFLGKMALRIATGLGKMAVYLVLFLISVLVSVLLSVLASS